jgi:hypothetical protein
MRRLDVGQIDGTGAARQNESAGIVGFQAGISRYTH